MSQINYFFISFQSKCSIILIYFHIVVSLFLENLNLHYQTIIIFTNRLCTLFIISHSLLWSIDNKLTFYLLDTILCLPNVPIQHFPVYSLTPYKFLHFVPYFWKLRSSKIGMLLSQLSASTKLYNINLFVIYNVRDF